MVVMSGTDGQIREGDDAQGVFRSGRRALARLELTVDGVEPHPIRGHSIGASAASFTGVLGSGEVLTHDPTLQVDRLRDVAGDVLVERITLSSTAVRPVQVQVELTVGTDLADLVTVKAGRREPSITGAPTPTGLTFGCERDGSSVSVSTTPVPASVHPDPGRLRWRASIGAGQSFEVTARISAGEPQSLGFESLQVEQPGPWTEPTLASGDDRLAALLRQSLADVQALLLADPDQPDDVYLAAGAPWFLTLCGRDALWAARMMLPLGTGLAASTLRTLARRQGVRTDASTGEQPGKVVHEVRRTAMAFSADLVLPACYYGTVDATPLWVCLLADAWRWGLDAAAVEPLLPALEAALGWLTGPGDPDRDGFLEYVDGTGRGLLNQGWKDSPEAIQWADGRLADAPIALCEVQGYAYEAATAGADLLAAFGRPGANRWQDWATDLQRRFRARFWVSDAFGPYPAVALDRDKRPVDSLTSNIGHLLGTGMLDAAESAAVAARLGAAAMDSGFGLRTLTAESPRFRPLSYHCGSVWPHDTAIAITGLARTGHHAVAGGLLRGLLAAAVAFDFRLPELYGGEQRAAHSRPLPYPAACRPQAWAAASAVSLLSALLGLEPDVPGGTLRVAPLRPSPVGSLEVHGLRLAGAPLSVRIAADGGAEILAGPAGLRLLS